MSWRISGVVAAGLVLGVCFARLVQDPETGTATWDASRAAGFAAYLLLWASTLLGIGVHFRVRPNSAPLTLVLESHRICSALSLSFVAGHVVALILDPVVHFSPLDIFVPLTAGYRPVQVALGTLTLWALAVTLGSTALAGRMSYTTWRKLHYTGFVCYVGALLHGLTAGTDTGNDLALTLYVLTASAVAAAAFARLLGREWVAAGEAPRPLG